LSGTKAGYAFDLTWLIAKDGVRAFWKRDWFVEPRGAPESHRLSVVASARLGAA